MADRDILGGRMDRGEPDALDVAEVREAYDRGRKDAKSERKRHPVMMTLLFVAAAVGIGLMALAAYNGSFSQAGKTVDANLATVATRAEPAVRDAAADAQASLREAGESFDKPSLENPRTDNQTRKAEPAVPAP